MQEAPLSGIKVIDQTQALAGPYAAMVLGDMGADVIKVERPGVGDNSRQWGPPFINGESGYYLSCNRNKRGIALNIATDEGQTDLRAVKPDLIYASISGYGRVGQRADQPGYDLVAQAESGTMALTGEVEGVPMRFPTAMADITCGLFTVIGILGALYARERSRSGQMLDISLQEGQMVWLANYAAEYFLTGDDPARRGNRHPQVVPYEAVQGSEGDWFILGVGSDNVWQAFCRQVGRDDLASDTRFLHNADRIANYDDLLPIVRDIIRQRPTAQWLDDLRAAGVPCGRINTVQQALSDPHVLERGMIVELEHPVLGLVKSLATPIPLSDTPISYRLHPPQLGEHTEVILRELGYSQGDIAIFRVQGVIA